MNPTDDLSAATGDLKNHAKEALRKAGDQLSEQAYQFRDMAADIRYNSEDFIRMNPWHSVFVAAGIGVLVGIIIARR